MITGKCFNFQWVSTLKAFYIDAIVLSFHIPAAEINDFIFFWVALWIQFKL